MRWCCFRQPSAGQADGEESTSNPAVAPADGYTSFADLDHEAEWAASAQVSADAVMAELSDSGDD